MSSHASASARAARPARKVIAQVDLWAAALDSLASATTPRERERAMVAFVSAVSPSLPGLAHESSAIVAHMRAALAADGFVDAMVGEPSSLIDAIDLPTMTAEDVALEAVGRAGAHNRVLQADTMLTAAAVSELLGSRSVNARQFANRLRASGELVAVPSRNRYLYPAFQIDAERHAVRDSVAQVNVMLGATDDPWGVASWWLLPSATLGGASPAQELEREGGPQRVYALAADVATGD